MMRVAKLSAWRSVSRNHILPLQDVGEQWNSQQGTILKSLLQNLIVRPRHRNGDTSEPFTNSRPAAERQRKILQRLLCKISNNNINGNNNKCSSKGLGVGLNFLEILHLSYPPPNFVPGGGISISSRTPKRTKVGLGNGRVALENSNWMCAVTGLLILLLLCLICC